MVLKTLLDALVTRFTSAEVIHLIATISLEHRLHYGFVLIDNPEETGTLIFENETVRAVDGIASAHVVVQLTTYTLSQIAGEARPVHIEAADLRILPRDFHFHVVQFLKALDITTDISTKLTPPFPLPLQHPVGENLFPVQVYEPQPLPSLEASELPQLICASHPDWVEMFDYAWQVAFKNLRQPEPESGFVSNYIDTAFNDNIFIWDSCFMMMFGRYARGSFDFMGTLDNFYAKQHADGFMCREINTYGGYDLFTPQDPRSTGPNILAWAEWQDYEFSGDGERLKRVFPALMAYHRWWRVWRRWPNGGFWTSGWRSGMDNQTRVPESEWHHRHYTWIDATMQHALSCMMLLRIADAINRHDFDDELQQDFDQVQAYINNVAWSTETNFYHDLSPEGELSLGKSIGAYWGILSQVMQPERLEKMIAHLEDPAQFNRFHRVPTQSADSPDYHADGRYWLGGVWAPTNYMVLRGLTEAGYDQLAYDIALNHVQHVAQVFKETGTLWENYAPETTAHGTPAKPNFVGWTGLSAISIPLEYILGLRWIDPGKTLLWDIRLLERQGVKNYPVGLKHSASLMFEPTASGGVITIRSSTAFELHIHYGESQHIYQIQHGERQINL